MTRRQFLLASAFVPCAPRITSASQRQGHRRTMSLSEFRGLRRFRDSPFARLAIYRPRPWTSGDLFARIASERILLAGRGVGGFRLLAAVSRRISWALAIPTYPRRKNFLQRRKL